jgi:hypothetical protein
MYNTCILYGHTEPAAPSTDKENVLFVRWRRAAVLFRASTALALGTANQKKRIPWLPRRILIGCQGALFAN